MPARQPIASPSFDLVFERLLRDLVTGRHPSGSRLPAERDLARELGASRPTLREALRRLCEWGLVAPRRGSGIVVRDRREWSLDVLPAYLRFGAPAEGPQEIARLLVDLLAVRRAFLVDTLRLIARRLGPGQLAAARAAADRAWAARHEAAVYVREDFQALRALVDAAGFLPALWLLNGLEGVYHELARLFTFGPSLPDDYLESFRAVFDALERRDGESAASIMAGYLTRLDQLLLTTLGIRA